MKVSLDRDTLFTLIAKAQNIVDKRNTMPVLSNVLIKAKGNTLKLYATDLEVSIKTHCDAEVMTEGDIVVNAKNFFDILRELPNSKILLEKQENHSLHITQNTSFFHIHGMDPNEFPVFPGFKDEKFASFSASLISEMIEKTIYSVSNDKSRYYLNGVLFEEENESEGDKTFRMVATDGHRLSLIDRSFSKEGLKLFESGVIVPKKGLFEIKKLMESANSDEQVEISVDGAQLVLKTQDSLLMIRLIEGKYPNYKKLLPEALRHTAIINREKLMSSLKRVSLLSNQKSKGVTFNFSKGTMTILSSSQDLGEAKEDLAVDYNEEDLKIGFNAMYIMDVLSSIEEDEIKMLFNDQSSPVLLTPVNDKNYTCVVMPMRTV
jgi:DNA polymerase-3 subunit beta